MAVRAQQILGCPGRRCYPAARRGFRQISAVLDSQQHYILDEPEAALSPQRQLALLGRLHQLVRGGSQFIVSTHSPILMAYPQARIFALNRDGIEQVRYTDTEHYCITRAFLQDPTRMLNDIFEQVEADGGDD